jgi:hypothetical protein
MSVHHCADLAACLGQAYPKRAGTGEHTRNRARWKPAPGRAKNVQAPVDFFQQKIRCCVVAILGVNSVGSSCAARWQSRLCTHQIPAIRSASGTSPPGRALAARRSTASRRQPCTPPEDYCSSAGRQPEHRWSQELESKERIGHFSLAPPLVKRDSPNNASRRVRRTLKV